LKKLVRFGVLRRIPYQESPKRYEYILTQKGLDLYPIIMSIVHWGNIHMVDARGPPDAARTQGLRKTVRSRDDLL
jgi:DNA-binding HxlR family transcriptional regulator